MLSLILTISMMNARPAAMTADFKPCVWPNVCKAQPVELLTQFKPCVWPNVCREAGKA